MSETFGSGYTVAETRFNNAMIYSSPQPRHSAMRFWGHRNRRHPISEATASASTVAQTEESRQETEYSGIFETLLFRGTNQLALDRARDMLNALTGDDQHADRLVAEATEDCLRIHRLLNPPGTAVTTGPESTDPGDHIMDEHQRPGPSSLTNHSIDDASRSRRSHEATATDDETISQEEDVLTKYEEAFNHDSQRTVDDWKDMEYIPTNQDRLAASVPEARPPAAWPPCSVHRSPARQRGPYR